MVSIMCLIIKNSDKKENAENLALIHVLFFASIEYI